MNGQVVQNLQSSSELNLKNFQLSKDLNELFHDRLLQIKAHFRGNYSSCSLISLSEHTPEIGVANVTMSNAREILDTFTPQEPARKTPEKSLQAWIILKAISNKSELPFGEHLTFITSELVGQTVKGKKYVNDILAIDQDNNLVVIELKSKRTTDVMLQTLKFKAYIEENESFFEALTKLMVNREWNKKIRCVAIWPKSGLVSHFDSSKFENVEVFGYDDNYKFHPENE